MMYGCRERLITTTPVHLPVGASIDSCGAASVTTQKERRPVTNVLALMSMSLDGYVADRNDGVAEVFDWYFSGDVEITMPIPTEEFTFHVSPPSAAHVRALMSEVGALLTGRRTFEVADGW